MKILETFNQLSEIISQKRIHINDLNKMKEKLLKIPNSEKAGEDIDNLILSIEALIKDDMKIFEPLKEEVYSMRKTCKHEKTKYHGFHPHNNDHYYVCLDCGLNFSN